MQGLAGTASLQRPAPWTGQQRPRCVRASPSLRMVHTITGALHRAGGLGHGQRPWQAGPGQLAQGSDALPRAPAELASAAALHSVRCTRRLSQRAPAEHSACSCTCWLRPASAAWSALCCDALCSASRLWEAAARFLAAQAPTTLSLTLGEVQPRRCTCHLVQEPVLVQAGACVLSRAKSRGRRCTQLVEAGVRARAGQPSAKPSKLAVGACCSLVRASR